MKTTQALSSLTLALAATFCLGASAATTMAKGTYDGAKDDIKATYNVAHDQCLTKSGNEKDVCMEVVKGQEKIALAHLEYHYTGKEKDRLKLHEAIYDARYDVAKEKCDDLSGDAKDVCVREAKTERDKAKASTKLDKKVTQAFTDAEAAMRKADYKLAKEKCDTLSGDKKDICEVSVKSRYPEM